MYYTYIIENSSGILYIGQSSNPDVRLVWHNSGKSRFTKNRGPWKFLYKKLFHTRGEAIKFERYLKSLKNPTYIKNVIVK